MDNSECWLSVYVSETPGHFYFFVTNIIWHAAEYLELLDIFYYCFEYFEVAIYDSNIEDTTALNFGSFSWQNSNGNNPNSCNHET